MQVDSKLTGPLGFPRSDVVNGPNGPTLNPSNSAPASGPEKAPGFSDLLDTKLQQPKAGVATNPALTKASEGVKFSNHALERLTTRGITIRPDEMERLNEAVEKAAQKGSKETLVLMGDNALIVSVKNKTVVTAMDREAMRDNVFTNIDSTVIL